MNCLSSDWIGFLRKESRPVLRVRGYSTSQYEYLPIINYCTIEKPYPRPLSHLFTLHNLLYTHSTALRRSSTQEHPPPPLLALHTVVVVVARLGHSCLFFLQSHLPFPPYLRYPANRHLPHSSASFAPVKTELLPAGPSWSRTSV